MAKNKDGGHLTGEALRIYRCYKGLLQACRNEGDDGREVMLDFLRIALELRHNYQTSVEVFIAHGRVDDVNLTLAEIDRQNADIDAILQVLKEEF